MRPILIMPACFITDENYLGEEPHYAIKYVDEAGLLRLLERAMMARSLKRIDDTFAFTQYWTSASAVTWHSLDTTPDSHLLFGWAIQVCRDEEPLLVYYGYNGELPPRLGFETTEEIFYTTDDEGFVEWRGYPGGSPFVEVSTRGISVTRLWQLMSDLRRMCHVVASE